MHNLPDLHRHNGTDLALEHPTRDNTEEPTVDETLLDSFGTSHDGHDGHEHESSDGSSLPNQDRCLRGSGNGGDDDNDGGGNIRSGRMNLNRSTQPHQVSLLRPVSNLGNDLYQNSERAPANRRVARGRDCGLSNELSTNAVSTIVCCSHEIPSIVPFLIFLFITRKITRSRLM